MTATGSSILQFVSDLRGNFVTLYYRAKEHDTVILQFADFVQNWESWDVDIEGFAEPTLVIRAKGETEPTMSIPLKNIWAANIWHDNRRTLTPVASWHRLFAGELRRFLAPE